MAVLAKRTISLTREHNKYIDKQLKSETYASASEVVRAGLRALQERDEAIEAWLRGPVLEAYDEIRLHPERGIPIEEAFNQLDAKLRTK